MEYARKVGRSLFWINSENGWITEKRHEDRTLKSLEHLDTYNTERLNDLEMNSGIKAQFNFLADHAKNSALSPDVLEPFRENLLPQFIHADLLAQRYQDRYMKAGSAIYTLAAAAVATITIQTLLFGWRNR